MGEISNGRDFEWERFRMGEKTNGRDLEWERFRMGAQRKVKATIILQNNFQQLENSNNIAALSGCC